MPGTNKPLSERIELANQENNRLRTMLREKENQLRKRDDKIRQLEFEVSRLRRGNEILIKERGMA